jgi:RNA polymerase sigma-70 factor (ECF subfamily)
MGVNSRVRPASAIAHDLEAESNFVVWLAPHIPSMTRLAQRLAGNDHWEDALQEAVADAWRQRLRFDAARGTARAWLLCITAGHCHRSWRKRLFATALPEPYAPTFDAEERIDMRRLLNRLSSRQRTAIDLYYYADLAISEVALLMGCSEGTVKSTLADARARLRDLIERN